MLPHSAFSKLNSVQNGIVDSLQKGGVFQMSKSYELWLRASAV